MLGLGRGPSVDVPQPSSGLATPVTSARITGACDLSVFQQIVGLIGSRVGDSFGPLAGGLACAQGRGGPAVTPSGRSVRPAPGRPDVASPFALGPPSVAVLIDQTGALTWSNTWSLPAEETDTEATPDLPARTRADQPQWVVGPSLLASLPRDTTGADSPPRLLGDPSSHVREVIPVSIGLTPQPSWQATTHAGAIVALGFGQTTRVRVEGATAAYSLDALITRAAASNGVVTLVGRAPGTTHVVVTTAAGVQFLRITVGEAPVTTLPGFTVSGALLAQSGALDLRYGSDAGLLQSTLRLMRREGSRVVELGLSSATALVKRINRSFALPLVSYTISDTRRTVTLMDSPVANSPLTVLHSNLRGLHWQEGPWQAHAGYSFFGTFEHLLLASEREQVAGLSYRRRLNTLTSLTPNLYFYRSPSPTKADGLAGTVVLETTPFQGVEALAEVGVGGGTGAAAIDVKVSRPNFSVWTTARFAPDALPSLSNDQPAGHQIEGGLVKEAGDWRIDAAANSQRFDVSGASQSSHVVRLSLTRLFAPGIQLQVGSFFSAFGAGGSDRPKVQSLAVPVGLSVATGHIGAGVDYQWSKEVSADRSGHLLRGNLSASARGFSLALSAERQTQTPTVEAAFSEEPALQRELDRLGIAANTPEQLADVLRTNASLAALGYASTVKIDLTPTRDRVMGRIAWTGSGRFQPRFELTSMVSRDAGLTWTGVSSLHAASSSAHIRQGTEAALTWSLVCHDRSEVGRPCQPALMASLRQQIGRASGLLAPGKTGDITGVVFRDDERLGRYGKGMPTLQGYEVILDGLARTTTDADGAYRFRRVRAGRHSVEVRLPDDGSLSLTTPSPVDVESGRSADFGIAVARSRLRVVVTSDAATPLGGVVLRASDGIKEYTLASGADGVAPFDGLDPGTYDVQLEAASLPVGHFAPVGAQRVTISPTLPGLVTILVRAARSIAGYIRLFDTKLATYVPAASVVVELGSTGEQVVTDALGRYVFRDLAPGDHPVIATGGGRTVSTTVVLPVGPATVTDIDLTLPAAGGSSIIR